MTRANSGNKLLGQINAVGLAQIALASLFPTCLLRSVLILKAMSAPAMQPQRALSVTRRVGCQEGIFLANISSTNILTRNHRKLVRLFAVLCSLARVHRSTAAYACSLLPYFLQQTVHFHLCLTGTRHGIPYGMIPDVLFAPAALTKNDCLFCQLSISSPCLQTNYLLCFFPS